MKSFHSTILVIIMIKFCFLSLPFVHSFTKVLLSSSSIRYFSHIDRYKKYRVATRRRAQVRIASRTEKNSDINTKESNLDNKSNSNNEVVIPKDRPFSLPPGEFAPKQSLGQNFLSDQNYVRKIVEALVIDTDHGNGTRVVEIGPGAGALTRVLYPKYPNMTAIELDQRSVNFLQSKLEGISIIHTDVLTVDWPALASSKGGRLNIIANLPYYIVSQVLFSLADSHKSVAQAVVTMQLEVAERLTAQPSTKDYGIPSVVFQLYCRNPKMLFKIPPTVFFPPPKVDSALVKLDFTTPNPLLETVCRKRLRKVLSESFQHRRKMLRQSLKELLQGSDCIVTELSEKWATKRPEQLTPEQFIELTIDIYGPVSDTSDTSDSINNGADDKENFTSQKVWRAVRL